MSWKYYKHDFLVNIQPSSLNNPIFRLETDTIVNSSQSSGTKSQTSFTVEFTQLIKTKCSSVAKWIVCETIWGYIESNKWSVWWYILENCPIDDNETFDFFRR